MLNHVLSAFLQLEDVLLDILNVPMLMSALGRSQEWVGLKKHRLILYKISQHDGIQVMTC